MSAQPAPGGLDAERDYEALRDPVYRSLASTALFERVPRSEMDPHYNEAWARILAKPPTRVVEKPVAYLARVTASAFID